MTFAPSYKKPAYTPSTLASRTRFGRPPRSPKVRFETYTWSREGSAGSHMPIDMTPHWNWRNPLNVIPLLMLLLFVLAIIGTMLAA